MKLKFKQQTYQTNAAMATVKCFEGQSKGLRKEVSGRTGFLTPEIFSNKKLEMDEEGKRSSNGYAHQFFEGYSGV